MTPTYHLIYITKIRRCISNKCYDIVKLLFHLIKNVKMTFEGAVWFNSSLVIGSLPTVIIAEMVRKAEYSKILVSVSKRPKIVFLSTALFPFFIAIP